MKTSLEKVCDLFGVPHVDVFAPDSFRVVYWNYRDHDGAVCGTLSGYGKTLEEACKRVLETHIKGRIVHNPCERCAQMGDF